MHQFGSSTNRNHSYITKMKFWGAIFIFSWCLARSRGWDENSPLYLNKKGDTYSFPRLVTKDEGKSIIRYKAPDETDTTTYIFCKNTDSEDEDNNDENILTGQVYSELDTDEPRTCSTPVTPVVETEGEYDYERIKCGTIEEENGIKFIVHYKLAEAGPDNKVIPGSAFSLPIYKFCYDDDVHEILYAEYTIDSPQLLNNPVLEEEQNHQFPLIANRYGEAMENAYKENLYNEPNMVGIPEFMPFALSRKPFYLYDSAAPLNKELVEVWEEFLLKIKKKLSKKTKPIKVYSGVYDRKRAHGTALYLNDDLLVPSPYAFWVLLYNEDQTEGVSLIMHNYAFNETEEKYDKLCSIEVCYEVGILDDDLPDPLEYKYALVYCCPASAITRLYPFKDVYKFFKF